MAQECKIADLEAGLTRAEAKEEQTKIGTSRPSRSWKIGLALLAIGLCTAVVALHNQRWDITDKNEVLTHILRKRDLWSNKLAIHLEGEYNATENSTVEWKDSRQEQGALKLINNKIVIPKTGLYFVYSRVSFRINCHMSPDPGQQQQQAETVHLSHRVVCESAAYGERVLMRELRSSCKRMPAQEDSGHRWYDTINLGAVFSLKEGDRLNTKTDPQEELPYVESDAGKTYFGVFAL